jgi:hypothetical protein
VVKDVRPGRVRVGLSWAATVLHTAHRVAPDQFEPGLPDEQQAREHRQDFVLMDWSASVGVGLTRRLEGELVVPVRMIHARAEFLDAGGEPLPGYESIHHRDETLLGVGDPSLAGRLRILRPEDAGGLLVDARAGLTLPLGRTEPNPFELARAGRPHQHMFFGSGTVDPLGGVEASYFRDGVRLAASATARAPLRANRHGYRAPTQLTGGVTVDAGLGLRSWRFLVGPEVYHETPATWSGEPSPNSGRTDLVAVAGAFWRPAPDVGVQLVARVPWTVRAEGGQLRMPIVASLGITWDFDAWGGGPAGRPPSPPPMIARRATVADAR